MRTTLDAHIASYPVKKEGALEGRESLHVLRTAEVARNLFSGRCGGVVLRVRRSAWKLVSEPSNFFRTTLPMVSESEAKGVVGHEAIADASLSRLHRYVFYFYTQQNGLWPIEVAGLDPCTTANKFIPFMAIKNVTKSYPPTMLIHGDADTDVPYEQSVMMAKELQVSGVPHELIAIKNGNHFLRGGDPADVAKAYEDAVRFVTRHTQ